MKAYTHKNKKTLIRFLACLLAALLAQAAFVPMAQAATFVYEYSDMIGQGGYIYYIRTADSGKASIYRLKLSSGESTKVLSASKGIQNMRISGKNIYYTTVGSSNQWKVCAASLTGSDRKTIGSGYLMEVDDTYAYCEKTLEDDRTQLYRINLETGEKKSVKIAKAGQTLDHVGNSEAEGYYYLYDSGTDRVALYRLDTASGKLLKCTVEKRPKNSGTAQLQISDVKLIGGEIYYDYGSYEGTGSYWYGSIKKLDTDGKKTTIDSQVGSDRIIAGSRELYYGDSGGNSQYKYNLSTGKRTAYSLKLEAGVGYSVLGDKTYMSNTSNKKKIVISRFNSGTDRETMTANFITIPFTQKKNVSYTVNVKQVGIYNVVCVTGTNYTDTSYGWKGKLTSVNYYATDGAGTVLGSFQ